MTAWYNEIDPYAAQWLRNLIAEGLIADGDVDTRSIVEVEAATLARYTQCHFFAGIGGWSLALRLAGWPDDRPVWTGSCPCQPFSLAGRQQGFADERHLWPAWRRLISRRRPATVLGEQVASAAAWLRLVRGDLETLGYAVGAIPVEAASAGAYHLRDRYWFVGHDTRERRREGWPEHAVRGGRPAAAGDGGAIDMAHAGGERQPQRTQPHGGPDRSRQPASFGHDAVRRGDDMGDTRRAGLAQRKRNGRVQQEALGAPARQDAADAGAALEWVVGADGKARRVEPGVRLLADGVPNRVAKLRAFGNAIHPPVAAMFIEAVMGEGI